MHACASIKPTEVILQDSVYSEFIKVYHIKFLSKITLLYLNMYFIAGNSRAEVMQQADLRWLRFSQIEYVRQLWKIIEGLYEKVVVLYLTQCRLRRKRVFGPLTESDQISINQVDLQRMHADWDMKIQTSELLKFAMFFCQRNTRPENPIPLPIKTVHNAQKSLMLFLHYLLDY